MRPLSLLAVLLVACPGRRIPEHLRPPDPSEGPATRDVRSVDDVIVAWVGNDPLARSTAGLSADEVRLVPEGATYAALLDAALALDSKNPDAVQAVAGIERSNRGTALVALSRGARLRLAEGYAGAEVDERIEGELLGLVTPLGAPREVSTLPLRAMAWMPREQGFREAVLTVGDRWVLAGWLDGPDIDLEPMSDAMNAPPFDALRRTTLAQVALGRAAGLQGDPEPGVRDLARVTRLILRTASADTTKAKRQIAAERAALKEELGTDGDPVDALLARATEGLIDAAGTDRGAGGALMAAQARRLYGSCPERPCQGFDRVDGIMAAGRWDPELAHLADVLAVAALKDGLDGLEVAQGTVRYPAAVVDLVDALIGNGATPPDPLVLLQRSPDSSTWLALARSVGAEQATTWEEARVALHDFARDRIQHARANETDREVRGDLDTLLRQLEP